jgi:hypothetical protein
LSVKPLKLLRLAPEINIILCTCINVWILVPFRPLFEIK